MFHLQMYDKQEIYRTADLIADGRIQETCVESWARITGETVSVNGPSEVIFLPPEGDSSFAVGDYYFVIAPGTFSSC